METKVKVKVMVMMRIIMMDETETEAEADHACSQPSSQQSEDLRRHLMMMRVIMLMPQTSLEWIKILMMNMNMLMLRHHLLCLI